MADLMSLVHVKKLVFGGLTSVCILWVRGGNKAAETELGRNLHVGEMYDAELPLLTRMQLEGSFWKIFSTAHLIILT
jgi:hypothetical protein